MADLTCDVAIIGAGTAGLAAERAARRNGAATLLIDPDFHGNTCTSVGCMPSKLLIAAGDAAHGVRAAGVFGVHAGPPRIDGAQVMHRVRALRDDFVASVDETVAEIPDGIAVRGKARFTGPTTLLLDDGRTIAAGAIVIATGSRPAMPEAFAAIGERILTNETVFELATLPASLGVIGAGPLGLELAQAFARLGVDVAVFDKGDALGGLHDEDADGLHAILTPELAIRLGVELEAAADGDGVRLSWTGADVGSQVFEWVLVASGRTPNLDDLGLDTTGLKLGEKGVPDHDRHMTRCGESAIFLAGDADAERPVLHEASSEGAIAGRNAAQHPAVTPGHRTVPFALMFTDPAVAVIGDTQAEDAITGTASFEDQGRARVMATNRGFVRLYANRGDGRLIGAIVAAPAGEHLAHLLAFAIEQGCTATRLLDMPIYHPTYEEGLKPALREICKCAGTEPPADRDEGGPGGA